MNSRAQMAGLMVAGDILAGIAAFAVAFWVRFHSGWIPEALDPHKQLVHFLGPGLVLSLAWTAWFTLNGLYRDWRWEGRLHQALVLVRAVAGGAAILLAALVAGDLFDEGWRGGWESLWLLSRWMVLGAFASALLLGSGALRWALESLRDLAARSGKGLEPVLVLGSGDSGIRAVRELLDRPVLGFAPVGFLDEDGRKTGAKVADLPVLGTYADLPRVVERTGAVLLVISHESGSHNEILRVLSRLDDPDMPLLLSPDLSEVVSGHLRTLPVHGTSLELLLQHHLPAWQAGLKRLMDVGFSLAILLASAPVLLLAMLGIRLDSPGPVFYTQERVGQYGRRFQIWKLRTMRTDAEKAGPQWAGKSDPRITRIGRLLRVTRVDEIPQLWCVLRGDMSLVGPRPERAFFIEKLREEVPLYTRRLKMKPGLTGWAQVTLPYDASLEDVSRKVRADLWYFEHMSLFLDFQILLRTVLVVLTGKGAR